MTPFIGVRRLSSRLWAMSSWASAFPGSPAIVAPPVSGIRARPVHVRRPALVEAALVLLGDPIGEHPRAVVASRVLPEAHLVVVGVAPRDDPLAGERGSIPRPYRRRSSRPAWESGSRAQRRPSSGRRAAPVPAGRALR